MSTDEMRAGAMEQAMGLSQVERVVDIFTAPSKTFTDILRDTSWWVPFLLAAVLSLASAIAIDTQVGFDTVVQNSLHETPKVEENLAGWSLRSVQRRFTRWQATIDTRPTVLRSCIFCSLL